jgi:hypothetical protein
MKPNRSLSASLALEPEEARTRPASGRKSGSGIEAEDALSSACYQAEAQHFVAEASASLLAARVALLDLAITQLREAAARAGIAVSPPPSSTVGDVQPHMNLEEFAPFMKLSVRKLAYYRKRMVEGIHFHKSGRRVIIHVAEAAEAIRAGELEPTRHGDIQTMAIDEVTRRRAKVALKRAKEKKL